MASQVRRVVTGHDSNGRAIVKIDDTKTLGNTTVARPGASSRVIWTTDTSPADNTADFDGAERKVGTTCPGGTVFRIVEYQPGVAPRIHRTNSIDYVVVLSGEIFMQLDDSEVHLKAGDVIVQRGTVHNWINRGPEPCVLVAVLIDAKPVTVAGKTLNAIG